MKGKLQMRKNLSSLTPLILRHFDVIEALTDSTLASTLSSYSQIVRAMDDYDAKAKDLLWKYFMPMIGLQLQHEISDVNQLIVEEQRRNFTGFLNSETIRDYWVKLIERLPYINEKILTLPPESIKNDLMKGRAVLQNGLYPQRMLNGQQDLFLDTDEANNVLESSPMISKTALLYVTPVTEMSCGSYGQANGELFAKVNYASKSGRTVVFSGSCQTRVQTTTERVWIRLPIQFKSTGKLFLQFKKIEVSSASTAYVNAVGSFTAYQALLTGYQQNPVLSDSITINTGGVLNTAAPVNVGVYSGTVSDSLDIGFQITTLADEDVGIKFEIVFDYEFIPDSRSTYVDGANGVVQAPHTLESKLGQYPLYFVDRLTVDMKDTLRLLRVYDSYLRYNDKVPMTLQSMMEYKLTQIYEPNIQVGTTSLATYDDYFNVYSWFSGTIKVKKSDDTYENMSPLRQQQFYRAMYHQWVHRITLMLADEGFLSSRFLKS